MTVNELKDILNQFDDNELVYTWQGNWPREHYGTNIKVSKNIYGSVSDEKNNTIYNPLIIL